MSRRTVASRGRAHTRRRARARVASARRIARCDSSPPMTNAQSKRWRRSRQASGNCADRGRRAASAVLRARAGRSRSRERRMAARDPRVVVVGEQVDFGVRTRAREMREHGRGEQQVAELVALDDQDAHGPAHQRRPPLSAAGWRRRSRGETGVAAQAEYGEVRIARSRSMRASAPPGSPMTHHINRWLLAFAAAYLFLLPTNAADVPAFGRVRRRRRCARSSHSLAAWRIRVDAHSARRPGRSSCRSPLGRVVVSPRSRGRSIRRIRAGSSRAR